MTDFSSVSDDDYHPNLDEYDTSDMEDGADNRPNSPVGLGPNQNVGVGLNVPQPAPRPPVPVIDPWVRVNPPEPERDVGPLFDVRNPGIQTQHCPRRNSKPIAYALLFFTTGFFSVLARETNVYANSRLQEKRDSGQLRRFSRIKSWVNVSIKELKKYIAILMNMGLTGAKNRPMRCFWDTRSSQMNPWFHKTMSVNRFLLINSHLHVTSRQNPPKGEPGYDAWNKVRFILDLFNNLFKKYFRPYQNVSIDESLVGMKNRCPFIQYLPNKKHKQYGIKKFECCDSLTNYVWHIEMYSGTDYLADRGATPFTEKVVLVVMEKGRLLDKGYHVFTDNFYTKIPLAKSLLDRNTFLMGTMNKNSKHLCPEIKNTVLGARQSLYYRQGETLLVSYRQLATRKQVIVLSTATHTEDKIIRSKKSNGEGLKPVLIDKYNQFMGGVDVSDKSVYHNSCDRHTTKYWKKLFFNYLDIAMFNAYVMY